MSRVKTGSMTGFAGSGEKGTRLIQRRMVSQLAERAAPTPSAIRTASPAATQMASGPRSGSSDSEDGTSRTTRGRGAP